MDDRAEQALRDALAFADSIIDTMRDPILVLDGSLRVIRASREFCRVFGVSAPETEGRLVYDLGDRQWDVPRLRVLLEEILPRDSTFRDFEVEHHFERLGRRVMLLNARKLYREQNAGELILLVIEDVTERRAAEEARRVAETRFTEMVKNVRDHSIFLTDPDGVITSWNVAAERIIGHTEAEAVGKHFFFIFTPEDVAAGVPEAELRQAGEQGRAEDERWHRRKDGSLFWALGIVTPLRDPDGRLSGFSKILRDMTERKRAEEALRQTEERFRLMVLAVKDYAIFMMDPAGKVSTWNEGAQHILGYAAEEIVGRSGALFFTPEDQRDGLFERELRTAAEQGRATDENWSVRKDGSRFWASGVSTALRDEGGGLLGFVKILRDLTERRLAEVSLRESEGRLRVALSAAEMGTWLWRIPQDEQILDDGLRRLMGLGEGEEVRTLESFLRAVNPEDRAAVRGAFERSLQEGRDLDVEFRVVWPDGSVHWLKDQGKVFAGPDGRAAFMAGACVDVTARRRAEEALREAHAWLERRVEQRTAELRQAQRQALQAERLAAIGQMVTGLAHESRNALQRGQACLSMLAHRLHGQPECLDLVGRLQKAQDDLHRLYEDVREYAAPITLDWRACDLAQVWREAWADLAAARAGRRAELREPQGDAGPCCEASPFHLRQVFRNLLDNALSVTDGPVEAVIRWTAAQIQGRPAVRVELRDNGPGFTAEQREKAFQPFFTTKVRGTGLGLAICARLIEAHGGTITLGEGEGPGAAVVITLPRRRA